MTTSTASRLSSPRSLSKEGSSLRGVEGIVGSSSSPASSIRGSEDGRKGVNVKEKEKKKKEEKKEGKRKEVGVERNEVACKRNKGCGRDSAGVVRETSCIVDES